TALLLLLCRSERMLQYLLFILTRLRAFSKASQPTVSYAFRISWRTSHSWLWSDCLASSRIVLTTEIGPWVEVPLRTEQLFPFKTRFFLQVLLIRSVKILVNIFLIVSTSVIGLVLSMSLFQSELFGIGMMLALFHAVGVFSSWRILLKRVVTEFMTT